MIIFPGCKINLGLSIIEKRDDGFHNIESVLYPISLYDALEIIPSEDAFDFFISGSQIPGDIQDNLVVKAYQIINQRHKVGPVRMHLHKNIPTGAGLGGGSSDGASTILLLNDLFDLKLTISQMEEYARSLGSDCAFFIQDKPAFAYQKGDQLKLIDTQLKNYQLVIVKPAMHINTAAAYSWIKPGRKEFSVDQIINLPVHEWENHLINDFETAVFERFPELHTLKSTLIRHGAVYASMTGTGSAIFALFDKNSRLPTQEDFRGNFFWSSKF